MKFSKLECKFLYTSSSFCLRDYSSFSWATFYSFRVLTSVSRRSWRDFALISYSFVLSAFKIIFVSWSSLLSFLFYSVSSLIFFLAYSSPSFSSFFLESVIISDDLGLFSVLSTDCIDKVEGILIILNEAWLWVSPDLSPRHSDVIFILTVDPLTGHFSSWYYSFVSSSLLLSILDKST